MPNISKNCPHVLQSAGSHQKYISRITKTLYYGKLSRKDRLSLPATELATDIFSGVRKGRSLDRLQYNDAARISKITCVSSCSLVLAVLYLEKLKKCNPEYLESISSSDLFLISLMVSCKYLYDDGEGDEVFVDEWAESTGTSIKELLALEKGFLKAIDWSIYVREAAFWKKLTELETQLAMRQGSSRGFFTYTELLSLLATIDVHDLIQSLSVISVVMMTSYLMALVTLIGSMFVVSCIPGNYIVPRKTADEQCNTFPVMQQPLENDWHKDLTNQSTDLLPLEKSIPPTNVSSLLLFNDICDHNDLTLNEKQSSWFTHFPSFLYSQNSFIDFDHLFDLLSGYTSKITHLGLNEHVYNEINPMCLIKTDILWYKDWSDIINCKRLLLSADIKM